MAKIKHNNTLPEYEIEYEIDSWSSFSDEYHPQNLIKNSRLKNPPKWVVDINVKNHFVILKLSTPCILKCLTFRKPVAHKSNALNQFKVYGSHDKNNWITLFKGHSNFLNTDETIYFDSPDDVLTSFVKFVPLSAWSYSGTIIVWTFQLYAKVDPRLHTMGLLKERAMKKYLDNCRNRTIRTCLKLLRTNENKVCYLALKSCLNNFEPLYIDKLYEELICERKIENIQMILDNFAKSKAFDEYYENMPHTVEWKLLQPNNPNNSDSSYPSIRGGHQMCIDSESGYIYLFGGWDGDRDLGDFWKYKIITNKWELISKSTMGDGGPSPRSCHQMCISREHKKLYVLGMFKDYDLDDHLTNDFYVYDIKKNKWTDLSNRDLAQNGPPLCFGHQMVYADKIDQIFVFGGNVLSEREYASICGQFYTYSVTERKWSRGIQNFDPNVFGLIEPRSDHTVHYDEIRNRLYITAGNRGTNVINEFCYLDLTTKTLHHIDDLDDQNLDFVPNLSYTMRSTFDTKKNHIYMLTGLERYRKSIVNQPSSNSLYLFDLNILKWKCLYKNKNTGINYWKKNQHLFPIPRFAFQFIYDEVSETNFLFGGNPGKYSINCARLNDMWACKIIKPSKEQVRSKMKSVFTFEQVMYLASKDPFKGFSQLRMNLENSMYRHSVDISVLKEIMMRIFDKNDQHKKTVFSNYNDYTFDNKRSDLDNKEEEQHLNKIFDSLKEYFEYEDISNIPPPMN